jgi:hypothetical protein
MNINEFVSGFGECIYVDYSQSTRNGGSSLSGYHPQYDHMPPYKAKTILSGGVIKMDTSGPWGPMVTMINKLNFNLIGGDRLEASPLNPLKPVQNWELYRWMIEKIKVKDPKGNVVTAIHDTIFWKSTIQKPNITTSWTWIYKGKYPLP